MTGCAEHHPYLAAVADGELEQVPRATVAHLQACPDCREEVEIQRALGAKILAAAVAPAQAASRRRGLLSRRAALRAAVVAVASVLASGGAFAFLISRPDPVLAAAAAASQPPQFQSTDNSRIASWCEHASGRSMPELDLAPLSPVGARIDQGAGTAIVTVFYVTPEGHLVAVSWLDSSQVPATRRSVIAREASGHLLLMAVSPHGTVVISGGAPATVLWQTAARIEDGTSS